MENDQKLVRLSDEQTELMLTAERYTVAHEAHGMGTVVWSEDLISVSNALDTVRSIPAVVAVEVVRCKNCKWAVFTSDGKPYGCSYLLSEKGSIYSVNGDFYCAYGARMDGRRDDGTDA